jgi:putative endonuclease
VSGRGSVLNGLAAEESALALYAAEGAELLARRWRCAEGEIDLVMRAGGAIVFVEVKARRRHDAVGGPVTAAQWRRLHAAASRYLAEMTDGTADCRFDVVLIDRAGRAERIENAVAFDGW